MALTVETLKYFMHDSLLENFPDKETEDGEKVDNGTLVKAVEIANRNYSFLTSSLPNDVVVRFDDETFCLKMALVHIYDYVLHDTALLHNISLTNLGISEEQVFEHFLKLKEMEQNDIDKLRQQLLDEIKDKDVNSKNAPVRLLHRYGGRLNGNWF